jgi:succinoglycan biosynthesis protein ExoO
MMADVSVIIAAYNVESYIDRAIQSALDQKDVTVEVITINDGSTDHTLKAIERIVDPRLKCINISQNSGPSIARNIGIAAATSKWIAILDADDAFLPDRLARCLARAKTLNADIVVDNINVKQETTNDIRPMFTPKHFNARAQLDLATFIAGNQCFLGGPALGYLKHIF